MNPFSHALVASFVLLLASAPASALGPVTLNCEFLHFDPPQAQQAWENACADGNNVLSCDPLTTTRCGPCNTVPGSCQIRVGAGCPGNPGALGVFVDSPPPGSGGADAWACVAASVGSTSCVTLYSSLLTPVNQCV